MRNLSPNLVIHVRPEGPADSLDPPRKRKLIPDPEKFTGDRQDFRRWYFEIFYKIEADRDTLGPLRM